MKTTRRNFVRGLGGATLALPLFSSLACSPRRDAAVSRQGLDGFPLRFVVWYMPNGNISRELPSAWDFAGSILEPLTPYQSKLLLVNGLDMSVHNTGPGEPHQQGMAFLTGRPLNGGSMVGGDGTLAGWASGISLDQHIANHVGGDTPRRSLHYGVQTNNHGGTEVRTVISYRGADQPVSNENSPWSMFDAAFSELGADPIEIERRRTRRQSVLDVVGGQYERVTPRLSLDDRRKLEQHLAAVRDIETRLGNAGADLGGSCAVPTLGDRVSDSDPSLLPVIGRMQMDLLAMSLACDVTRVATLQWSASTNNRPYPFLSYDEGGGPQPIVGDEHILGHEPYSNVHAWGKLRVIRQWYMEQLAYLLGKLDSIPEGEGTMLDNTIVLLASELSEGNSHSHMNTPFLIAGGGGAGLATGRRLDIAGDVSHNDLFVSLLNTMGIEDTRFGDPAFCTGPLAGIRR